MSPKIIKGDLTKDDQSIIFRYMSNTLDKDLPRYAEMFKALSNTNRLRIFLRLISCCKPGTESGIMDCGGPQGCACVGELGQDLGIVGSTISHHIKELRQAGLIRRERQGQKIVCWIDPEAVSALRSFFE